ncbi:MAG TPA: VWA domain-containing protein [Caldimonas sp.]|nr:VWA domain-containing protein [Caldimonas sp.]
MTFFWPEVLWLLLALPALVAGYVFLLRRRKLATLRVSNLAMIREAVGPPNYRRHIPPAILLASIAALIVAIARPAAVVSLPGLEETVILAIDVSASMRATDVQPSRLDAAQRAAKAFVAAMPKTVRIGIVSFAGSAAVAQGPTLDHREVEDAIERLTLGPSTNLYGGIALSLAAMFPQDSVELEHFTDARTSSRFSDKPHSERSLPTSVEPGSYRSGAIVLLSDGQRTMGGDPLDAARMAAARGVKVYTVGLGTPEGSVISFRGWSIRVKLDEETLKEIARMTGAKYFSANSADTLRAVYEGLSHHLVTNKKETELTGAVALLAALLMTSAAGLSMAWFGFRP